MIKMEDFLQRSIGEINYTDVAEMISKIDKGIEDYIKYPNCGWIRIILTKEYNLASRNKVAEKYVNEGGWYRVAHVTSSENNEKAGITAFCLFTDIMYDIWLRDGNKELRNCYRVFGR